MSEGIQTFGEGVAASTLEKARKAGRNVDDHVSLELMQLEALIAELDRVEAASADEARSRAGVLKNLAIICEASYRAVRGVADEDAFRERFVSQFKRYGELIRTLEDAYEGCVAGGIAERTRAGVYAAVMRGGTA